MATNVESPHTQTLSSNTSPIGPPVHKSLFDMPTVPSNEFADERADAERYGEYDGDYRELNRAAMVCLALGIISLVAVFFPSLLVIPLAGLLTGAIAYWHLMSQPNDQVGWVPNHVGMVLCGVLFVGGTAWHTYDYVTEVPEGYARISFYDLQPDPDHPELPIPPAALDMNGQRIFVKGFVFPDGQNSGIKKFILVPDRGTCCFGGNPKPTDMIQVTLKDPLRVSYSYSMRKLGGTLRVDRDPRPVAKDMNGVHYILDADYVQ